MELVLATNFEDALVDKVADLPVSTFFGGFPISLTGAGRPPYILPDVTRERFRDHISRIHRGGHKFIATLNSIDLGLKEYDPDFRGNFLREVSRLLDLGVDGFVVAIPMLIEAIHREYPEVPISASTFARIRTVAQGEYFLRLGARTLILEEANRDLGLVRGLVKAGAEVEILTNQTCIRDCPYRAHHLNTSSLCSQPGGNKLWFELPILQCGLEILRDPTRLISSIWVRPEDLGLYEEAGVHRFKISGRNRSTEWLVRSAQAYADRRYDGNLLDILSYVQVKGPGHALASLPNHVKSDPEVANLQRAFARLDDVIIDNNAFPPGFQRKVTSTDCAHTSCQDCGYCAAVAERVVRISGRSLSLYRGPENLPTADRIVGHFGRAPR